MITFTTGYYLHYQKVDLHSPHLHSILNLLHTQVTSLSNNKLEPRVFVICLEKYDQVLYG